MRPLRTRRYLLATLSVALGALFLGNVWFGSDETIQETDVTLDESEVLVADDRLVEAEIRVDTDVVVGTFTRDADVGHPVPFEATLTTS